MFSLAPEHQITGVPHEPYWSTIPSYQTWQNPSIPASINLWHCKNPKGLAESIYSELQGMVQTLSKLDI